DRNVSLDRAAAQLKSWDKQREKISLRERHIFNNNRKYVEYIEGSDPEEFKKRQQEWKEMQRKVKM
ncbi:MAG: hypothetical protein LBU65_13035, partial [Planctomycetaceae bacterium]|nr:hypothetical protein [Planctomycetaceae bacterium]